MKKKRIDALRKYYSLSDSVTDEQIAKDYCESLGAAVIDLDDAAKAFSRAVAKHTPGIIKKMFKR